MTAAPTLVAARAGRASPRWNRMVDNVLRDLHRCVQESDGTVADAMTRMRAYIARLGPEGRIIAKELLLMGFAAWVLEQ